MQIKYTSLSVNMNYGEHERNRIKRRNEVCARLEKAGIKYTTENGYGGYNVNALCAAKEIPANALRLSRVIYQHNEDGAPCDNEGKPLF